jgi:hypothetical protein
MSDPNLEELIRQRAYAIWIREGRPDGRARIHWLRAEAELRERICIGSSGANVPRSLRRSSAENLAEGRAEKSAGARSARAKKQLIQVKRRRRRALNYSNGGSRQLQ